jgi:hypothetical protein
VPYLIKRFSYIKEYYAILHRMIAAAFILMKRRRSKEYNEIIKALLKEAIKLSLVLNPTVI